mgnify:FL=1
MAMVVQHNLTAMNSNRQLSGTTSAQAKSAEKLSSGYRINRAGDDAAGLKISEKMRSQIRGLDKASSNAQDGISLIQTAEGALNEAHSILQRMNELAVQGANDTNESIDRDAINQELSQLTDELDRISTTTQFNKQNLLDGSFASKNLQVGANANQKITVSIDNMNASSLGLRSIKGQEQGATQTGHKPTSVNYKGMTYTYDTTKKMSANQAAAADAFRTAIANAANENQYATSQLASGSIVYYASDKNSKFATAGSAMVKDISIATKAMSADMKDVAKFKDYLSTVDTVAEGGPTVAASGAQYTLTSPKVDTYAQANSTITAVQDAINKVSSQRSALGAIQNRLEHTVSNLDNVSENTQSAESRIRDTDMASEMVNYSKNNILAQAGQSMLAQANQSTQGVLSLLQ